MTNAEVAGFLREISLFLDMTAWHLSRVLMRRRAYAVDTLDRPVQQLYLEEGLKGLSAIPSVGRGIAERIEDCLQPAGVRITRNSVANPGRRDRPHSRRRAWVQRWSKPCMTSSVYARSPISSARRNLERFGRSPTLAKRPKRKSSRVSGFLKQATGRQPIGRVLDLVQEIEMRLRDLPGVTKATIAGSIRRWQETIGDADFLVISRRPERGDGFLHRHA